MEKLSQEKYKEFLGKVSLENLFSGASQTELIKLSANERMEQIVRKIAELAKQSGIPAETLKNSTFEFEIKKDNKTGKNKLSKLTKIESLSKKVNKQFEQKHPETENQKKPTKATVHLTKDFVRTLLAEKDKEKQVAMMQAYLSPEFKNQGFTEEMLNKPMKEINFNNIIMTPKFGTMPFIECISRAILEDILKTRDKIFVNGNKIESDFYNGSEFIHKDAQPKKNNNENDKHGNDQTSETKDAINDMVTGGDSYDINENQNGETEIKDNKPKELEDMTPEEQI